MPIQQDNICVPNSCWEGGENCKDEVCFALISMSNNPITPDPGGWDILEEEKPNYSKNLHLSKLPNRNFFFNPWLKLPWAHFWSYFQLAMSFRKGFQASVSQSNPLWALEKIEGSNMALPSAAPIVYLLTGHNKSSTSATARDNRMSWKVRIK